MRASKLWMGVATVAGLMVLGCGPDKTPSNAKLTKGLNAYYSGHDDCLYEVALKFPYTVSAKDKSEEGARKMDALEASGLLTKSVEGGLQENRYSLTPYGNKVGGRFCFGHRVVSSVDGFTPTDVEKGFRTTTATYHYTMADVPTWAKSDQVLKAFPDMAKKTGGSPVEGTDKLSLTYNGWEVQK